MKKTLQATVLLVLAASAIVAAAISRPQNVKNYWPDEWNQSHHSHVADSSSTITRSTNF